MANLLSLGCEHHTQIQQHNNVITETTAAVGFFLGSRMPLNVLMIMCDWVCTILFIGMYLPIAWVGRWPKHPGWICIDTKSRIRHTSIAITQTTTKWGTTIDFGECYSDDKKYLKYMQVKISCLTPYMCVYKMPTEFEKTGNMLQRHTLRRDRNSWDFV